MDEKLIDFFENFPFPQKPGKEPNIFDVGIRRMYENPFTEILASILRQDSPYDNHKEFIKFFILELTGKKEIAESFRQKLNIETQINTKKGNFIDMIIHNDKYVITFENKIEHIPNNPFKNYETEVKRRYPNQDELYYIFSLYECETEGNWKNKLIGDVFSGVKNKLQFKRNNKWDYFVEDFLNHYIEERIPMTKKDFAQCEKYFSKFMEGRDCLDEFIKQIENELTEKIKPLQKIKHEKWEGCIVIIIKPFKRDFPYIALWLDYENMLSLDIIYEIHSVKSLPELAVGNKYSRDSSGKNEIWFKLKEEYSFNNLKDAYKEIEIQLNRMKQIDK
jgi:hypothetical protein